MSKIIHPAIFCRSENSSHKQLISKISDSFINNNPTFFKEADYSISVEELLKFKPTIEQKIRQKEQGIEVRRPYLISFVEVENEENIEAFFEFWNKLSEDKYLRENEYSDFLCLNVFIRNFSRLNASQLADRPFFEKYEAFLKDNSSTLSLKNTYNIIVDNRQEGTGDKAENSWVFTQLFQELQLFLLCDKSIIDELNHSGLPAHGKDNSPVRYNSLGIATVGFNEQQISEGILLKRKIDTIGEIINDKEIDDSTCLEITRKSNCFFEEHFKDLDKKVFENSLNLSFMDYVDKDFLIFQRKQDKADSELSEKELIPITDKILKKIDSEATLFKEKMKLSEEDSIRYALKVGQRNEEAIMEYTASLLDTNDPSAAINSTLYGLNALLQEQKTHEITKKGSSLSCSTLYDKLLDIENRIQEPDKENLEEREDIKATLRETDEKINKQYELIKIIEESMELKWFTKNMANTMIATGGVILSVLLFFFTPIGLSICVLCGIALIGTAVLRALSLKKKLEKATKNLNSLNHDKEDLVRLYIQTYIAYFESIQTQIGYKHVQKLLYGSVKYTQQQIDLLEQFKNALKKLQLSLQEQFNSFDLSLDYFNYSILRKEDIEYFCQRNKLIFFDKKRRLSLYFNEYLSNGDFFDRQVIQFLRNADVETLVSTSEIIKPNEEGFRNDLYKYKEIEKYEVEIYIADENESQDILYSDVKQGQLGDCYFLASLAAIANKKPDKIKEMIDISKIDPAIYFYDDLLQTHKIHVDKKFWVTENDEFPIYAQYGSSTANKKEIWTMLIEKAWAKINDCNYANIIGSNGKNRRIDFSLALTGIKAINESIHSNNNKYISDRINAHILQKPVVLYSVGRKSDKSHPDLVENHAYALISSHNDRYEIYNPHGNVLSIISSELSFNFDTVLYFDFNYEEDIHLNEIFTNYFVSDTNNKFLKDLEAVIKHDISEKILQRDIDELLDTNVFGIKIDDSKKQVFSQQILEASVPFVYLLSNISMNAYKIYFIGKNDAIREYISDELEKHGAQLENDLSKLNHDEKKIGILRVHNNLKLIDISIN